MAENIKFYFCLKDILFLFLVLDNLLWVEKNTNYNSYVEDKYA